MFVIPNEVCLAQLSAPPRISVVGPGWSGRGSVLIVVLVLILVLVSVETT